MSTTNAPIDRVVNRVILYGDAHPEEGGWQVSVGDKITEGQTLCIIEAMKVMNEIKAETSGVITEISIEDATPVQYGDVLFRLK